MLNVDIKKSSNTLYNNEQPHSDNEGSGEEELRNSQTILTKKNLVLPQLKGLTHNQLNNSADLIKTEGDMNMHEENKNDQYKPKMYLIFFYVKLKE